MPGSSGKRPARPRASAAGTEGRSGYLRASVIVHGLVQGVFFRASTRDEAIRLGVGGWVRNLPDGTVEALFEGETKRVEEVVAWCHRGPAGAEVSSVDVTWEPYRGEFHHFDIRYGYHD